MPVRNSDLLIRLESNAFDDAGPKAKARAANVKMALQQVLVPAPIGKGAKSSEKGRSNGCKGSPKDVLAAFK